MARRRSTSSSSSRSPLASNIRLILSVVNTIMRVFSFFRGKSRSTPTRADEPRDPPLPRTPPRSPVARNTPRAAASSTRSKSASAPAVEPVDAPRSVGTDGGIPDLFRQQRSDVVVTASGRVV